MKNAQRQEIEQKAENVLRESGAYRIPVPVDVVANHLKLTLQESIMREKISGLLVVENKRGAVSYNAAHAQVRQRFTIAHEIGHYILHVLPKPTLSRLFIDRYVAYRSHEETSNGDTNEREEIEANVFGAALLMPAELVREEIRRKGFDLDDEEDIDALAKRFSVSPSAMSYRLVNLGLVRYPDAIRA